MDLPVTAPMWNERDIRVVHLEPTDVCQARCPQCSRETDRDFDATQRHHLSVSQIQDIIPHTVLTSLEKMFMCGSYGDPAAGLHSLDLARWFRQHQPNIVLGLHSNGGLRDVVWWQELASIFDQPRDYVVFSIDGLEDTNHIYRRGVSWSQVMRNAQAYIDAGGAAHWDMLVYQHNQHQVDQCEKLARSMGFRWFRAKVTRRPLIANLQAPQGWINPTKSTGRINCHALRERSIYVDAQARVSPCCWLGDRQGDFITDFGAVQQSWTTGQPHEVCAAACSEWAGHTNFEHQWQKNLELS